MVAVGKQKVPNNRPQAIISPFGTDMFGRLKTSEPITLFDSAHRYRAGAKFSSEVVGEGSSTGYLSNESTVTLNVGTASGNKVTLESKRVFPYQPGKSLQVMQTFAMAPPKANLRQRVGYFSRQNGIFLEQTGTEVYLVKRTYVSGQVVETRVAQADWNMDPLDGTGASDLILDLTKTQIFWSEYEWLGVGTVRAGFAIDGVFITVHHFNHANHIDTVYMTTASLPVRYEIENIGATASSSTFKQICVSVISNGGYNHEESEIYTAWRTTAVTVGTDRYPLVAIRMKAGFTDSVILPTFVDVISETAGNGGWALVKNPSSITGGTWVTDEFTGNVEYNVTATAMSQDGIPVRRSFFATSNQSAAQSVVANLGTWDLQLGRTNSDNPVSDVFVLSFRSLKNTMTVQGMLGWHDLL